MKYRHSTHTLTTSQETVTLFWQKWIPPDTVERIIVFQHGIGEHSGRYQPLLDAFANTRTAFYALDARGHGQTKGPRGQLTAFGLLASDLGDLVDVARTEQNLPTVFLLGHSMGGAIALEYVLRADHQRNVRGLILSSPAIEVSPSLKNKLLKGLSKVLIRAAPGYIMDTGLNLTGLSHDAEEVAAYRADPLVHGKASVATGYALFHNRERFMAQAHKISVPVYLFHGAADRVTSPQGSKRFFDSLTTPDKTFTLYEGLYHETMNERPAERKKVLSDLMNWVIKH